MLAVAASTPQGQYSIELTLLKLTLLESTLLESTALALDPGVLGLGYPNFVFTLERAFHG